MKTALHVLVLALASWAVGPGSALAQDAPPTNESTVERGEPLVESELPVEAEPPVPPSYEVTSSGVVVVEATPVRVEETRRERSARIRAARIARAGEGRPWTIAGGVTLGVSWLGNGLVSLFGGVAISDGGRGAEWEQFRAFGFIPLAGPFMQLAAKPTSFQRDAWGGWLLGAGALQLAGATMLVAGLVMWGNHEAPPPVVVVPTASAEQLGLTVAGSF